MKLLSYVLLSFSLCISIYADPFKITLYEEGGYTFIIESNIPQEEKPYINTYLSNDVAYTSQIPNFNTVKDFVLITKPYDDENICTLDKFIKDYGINNEGSKYCGFPSVYIDGDTLVVIYRYRATDEVHKGVTYILRFRRQNDTDNYMLVSLYEVNIKMDYNKESTPIDKLQKKYDLTNIEEMKAFWRDWDLTILMNNMK